MPELNKIKIHVPLRKQQDTTLNGIRPQAAHLYSAELKYICLNEQLVT